MGKKMGRIQRVHDLYEPNFAHLNGGMCQIYLSLKSKMAEAPILNFQKMSISSNWMKILYDTDLQWRNDELFSWWKVYIRNWKHLKATRTAVVWMTGWEVEEYLAKSGLTFTIRRGPKCTLRTADEFSCQFFDDDVIHYNFGGHGKEYLVPLWLQPCFNTQCYRPTCIVLTRRVRSRPTKA